MYILRSLSEFSDRTLTSASSRRAAPRPDEALARALYTCLYIIYIYIYIYTYVKTCVCVYVYIYTYVHIIYRWG